MFSIEEPAVSTRMGEDKIKRHMATGAEYVTGPDSSCLMHMAGIAKKEKIDVYKRQSRVLSISSTWLRVAM